MDLERLVHTLTNRYTPTGRLAAQQLDDQPVLTNVYDVLGRRTERILPSGAYTSGIYDSVGNATHVRAGSHTIAFRYDTLGRTTDQRVTGFPEPVLRFDSTPGLPYSAARPLRVPARRLPHTPHPEPPRRLGSDSRLFAGPGRAGHHDPQQRPADRVLQLRPAQQPHQ